MNIDKASLPNVGREAFLCRQTGTVSNAEGGYQREEGGFRAST